MKTGLYWVILFLIILLDFFLADLIGLRLADWNEPITETDLIIAGIAFTTVLIIEIRQAANYIVEQIKGTDV